MISSMFPNSCDFVELTDILGQRIDRLNGSRSGFTVTVRGVRTSLLRIRFTTDRVVTRQGFKAQYSITFGEWPILKFQQDQSKKLSINFSFNGCCNALHKSMQIFQLVSLFMFTFRNGEVIVSTCALVTSRYYITIAYGTSSEFTAILCR